MEFVRIRGQSPMLPGAVRADSLIYTSGVVAPQVLAGEAPPFGEQASAAMLMLLSVLADAGAGPADVVKLEAFLADPADFAEWNAVFVGVWPESGPARTTLVSAFAAPGVLIELQAIAVVG